jgi:hypothetical protein
MLIYILSEVALQMRIVELDVSLHSVTALPPAHPPQNLQLHPLHPQPHPPLARQFPVMQHVAAQEATPAQVVRGVIVAQRMAGVVPQMRIAELVVNRCLEPVLDPHLPLYQLLQHPNLAQYPILVQHSSQVQHQSPVQYPRLVWHPLPA